MESDPLEWKTHSLGDLRLRDRETNELLLIPTPSGDPNDPLNWPVLHLPWPSMLLI